VLTIFGCVAAAGAFDEDGTGLECHARLRRSEMMRKVDDLVKETLGGSLFTTQNLLAKNPGHVRICTNQTQNTQLNQNHNPTNFQKIKLKSAKRIFTLTSSFNAHRPYKKTRKKTIDETGKATIPTAPKTKFHLPTCKPIATKLQCLFALSKSSTSTYQCITKITSRDDEADAAYNEGGTTIPKYTLLANHTSLASDSRPLTQHCTTVSKL
jgi:hypothetical protein